MAKRGTNIVSATTSLPPMLQTAPSLELRIKYENGNEKVIAFASNLQFNVVQGQKPIFVVDSPFPAEIANGAAPSYVTGSMTVYLPKGQTMESAGLVPRSLTEDGSEILAATASYANIMVYDRLSDDLVIGVQGFKCGSYSFNMASRTHIIINLQFAGLYIKEGVSY